MRKEQKVVLAATGALLVAICGVSDKVASAADKPASTLHEAMTATIIPKSALIWELAGNLYDDNGNINSNKLTDAQWVQLKDAAVAMRASAKTWAEAGKIKVAAQGIKIQNEGTPGSLGAAEVQAAIDADLKGFKAHANNLASIADEIAAAAAAHDGTKTDETSARLTDVCGACHAKYWYPGQK